VVNSTREATRQRGTRPHLGCITTDYFRSQLSCGDALGTRGHCDGTGNARQTTISLDAEASDRAVSSAYERNRLSRLKAMSMGRLPAPVEAATPSSSARLLSSETL